MVTGLGNFDRSIDAEQGRIQSHDGIGYARIQTNASLALSIDKPILLTRFGSLSTINFATLHQVVSVIEVRLAAVIYQH